MDLTSLNPQAIVAIVVFIGAALGGTLAAVLPYYKKLREEQQLGNSTFPFDRKFLGTLFLAFVVGVIGAIFSFDNAYAQVNQNDTMMKIFIAAFVYAAGGNIVFNAFIKPSGLAAEIAQMKTQQAALVEENKALKTAVGLTPNTNNNNVITTTTVPVVPSPVEPTKKL